MRRRILPALGLAVSVSLAAAAAGASESFTIEGSADALTLTADKAVRSVVVAAIAERFGIEIVGNGLTDGAVDGRFSGDLGDVIKAVLPGDGYGIAYSKGRPVRITFSGAGSDAPLPELPRQSVAAAPLSATQNTSSSATSGGMQVPVISQGALSSGVRQQLMAARPQDVPPPPAMEGSQQEQLATAQQQALRDLKRLVDDLKKSGQ